MADTDPTLRAFVTHGREERNLEYKGDSGREPIAWGRAALNAKIAKTTMAMANIGGGTIVLGMDQVGTDEWQPNGVTAATAASYQQDQVQQYVNRRADPYVALAVRHIELEAKFFVIIDVTGFDDLPVVCTASVEGVLRQGAIYTRSFRKHETVEIQSASEMRELLDRAIDRGVRKQLRPLIETLAAAGLLPDAAQSAERRFEAQRGDL